MLCGVDVRRREDHDDMVALARQLLGFGPTWALVKGGHFAERSLTESRAPDILVGLRRRLRLRRGARRRRPTITAPGCSLSAAICAGLALGRTLPDAARDAKSFVLAALTSAADWKLGRGRGPIDHLGWGE